MRVVWCILFYLALLAALETLQEKDDGRCYVRAAFYDISVLLVDAENFPASDTFSDLVQEV